MLNGLPLLFEWMSNTGRFLFDWSWRTFLLLMVVCVIVKLARWGSPSLRYKIWLTGLLAVTMIPAGAALAKKFSLRQANHSVISFIVEMPTKWTAPERFTAAPSNPTTTAPALKLSLIWAGLFSLWLIGFLFAIGRLLGAQRKSHRQRQAALAISLQELGCADSDLTKSGLSSTAIKLSPETSSPVLVGLFRPTILLPADIVSWTTVEERQAILLHEMIHRQRFDPFANYFQALLDAIFFFHPLVRYASNQLGTERELACDERALGLGVTATSYIDSILKVAERNVLKDVAYQTAFVNRKTLERRIEMILKNRNLSSLSRRWLFLVLPMALILTAVWLLIPNRSVSAQQNSEQIRTLEEEMIANMSEILSEATEKQVIVSQKHSGTGDLLDIQAENSSTDDKNTIIYTNVTLKTPEFIFKSPHGESRNGVITLVDPVEVQHNGETYFSYNSIAIAQRKDRIFYVVGKDEGLYKEKPSAEENTFVLQGKANVFYYVNKRVEPSDAEEKGEQTVHLIPAFESPKPVTNLMKLLSHSRE